MQIAKGLVIPIKPDSVLSPDVYYGDELTGIYFMTDDDQFGRISFNNLDSIKVSRGEYLPYPDDWDWKSGLPYCWLKVVDNSEWLKERYNYESRHYRGSYEFAGNVDDMLTDFQHYIFSFHDQFIEVIARGFWFEQSPYSLINQPLSIDHPSQPLPKINTNQIVAHGLTSFVRINPISIEKLMQNSLFHQQTLMEFRLDCEDRKSADHCLTIERHKDRIVSRLRGYFSEAVVTFDHIATLDDTKPYIEKYMSEVAKRRKENNRL